MGRSNSVAGTVRARRWIHFGHAAMTTTQPLSLVRARLITPISLAVRLSAIAAAALGLFVM